MMLTIMERRKRCRELMRRYFGDVPSREESLHQTIAEFLRPTDVLLDAGCGNDLPLLAQYGAKTALAIGVDVDPPIVRLPVGVRAVLGNLENIPVATSSVDLVMSRSVVEHLEHPARVFQELNRVLRPGGRLIFTTPNKYYYSCLLARLAPDSWKAYYFRTVFGEDAYDYFPVHYRANTAAALRRTAAAANFRVERIVALRHYPYYFMFSPLLFRLGTLYDRIVTRWRFDQLQSTWLVVMEKAG